MNMTTWIFLALAQLVGEIDLCLLATRGPEATFSAAILAGSRRLPDRTIPGRRVSRPSVFPE